MCVRLRRGDQYTAGKYVERAAAMVLSDDFRTSGGGSDGRWQHRFHSSATRAHATAGDRIAHRQDVLSPGSCSPRWSSLAAAALASPSPPHPAAHRQAPLRSVLPRLPRVDRPSRPVPSSGGNQPVPSTDRRKTSASPGAPHSGQGSTRILSSRRCRPRHERAPTSPPSVPDYPTVCKAATCDERLRNRCRRYFPRFGSAHRPIKLWRTGTRHQRILSGKSAAFPGSNAAYLVRKAEHDRRHRHRGVSDPARRQRGEACDPQAGSLTPSPLSR